MYFTSAHLGDQLTITNTATGEVIAVEFDALRVGKARLGISAPKHYRIERVDLADRVKQADMDALFSGEDGLVEDESEAQA